MPAGSAAWRKKNRQAVGLSDYEMEELKLLCVLHDVAKSVFRNKIQHGWTVIREEWEVCANIGKRIQSDKATPELKTIAEAFSPS
jgi:hypothetical protein